MMQISWKKVPYIDEKEEFERTVKNFSEKVDEKENNTFLKKAYTTSKLISLNDRDWKNMENTDSWNVGTFENIQKIIKGDRNITVIINEFFSNSVRAPIAIRLGEGQLYLVGGNTRLMAASVLGVKPKIVVVETDW
jgi:hypothetical protein